MLQTYFHRWSNYYSTDFSCLNDIKGTLILDEADLKASDMTNDIVKILNMGYSKGGSVLRMKGKDFSETRAFDVFSPKSLQLGRLFMTKHWKVSL